MLQCGAFDKAYEGYTMDDYISLFLFTMAALVAVFVWLERDVF